MAEFESEIAKKVVANGWRQGDILPATSHEELAKYIDRNFDDAEACIVISHSCELTRPDTTFELVIGTPTGQKKLNSGFAFGRSRKKLEIDLSVSGILIPIAIETTARYSLPIEILASTKPDTRILANDTQRESLIEWLVAKYARPGFPEAFERRVAPQIKRLYKVTEKFGQVWRIYLGLSSWADLDDTDSYWIEIYFVVKDAQYQNVELRANLISSVREFAQILSECDGLELSQDSTEMIVSDEDFPISCEHKFRRWEKFDYISLAHPDHNRDVQ